MGSWPGCPFQQATSRSRHTGPVNGAVNVAMADGSVQYLGGAVDQAVWWYMCVRDDGVSYTQPW